MQAAASGRSSGAPELCVRGPWLQHRSLAISRASASASWPSPSSPAGGSQGCPHRAAGVVSWPRRLLPQALKSFRESTRAARCQEQGRCWGLLMTPDTQFLRAPHSPGPSGAFCPLVASWHSLPHTSPSCLPTALSHQGLHSPSSLHVLPEPHLLRVSPSLANLTGSTSAAAPQELQRSLSKRHHGALSNPASNSRAGGHWCRFPAATGVLATYRQRSHRDPRSCSPCPPTVPPAQRLQQNHQRPRGFWPFSL